MSCISAVKVLLACKMTYMSHLTYTSYLPYPPQTKKAAWGMRKQPEAVFKSYF